MIVKLKPLVDTLIVPQYQTEGSAGVDIHCIEEVRMLPNVVEKVRTGISVEIPVGYELQVRPRSSLAARGITVTNSPGTIDSDYRGEICVLLHSPVGVDIRKGERIAQLVLKKVERIEWQITTELGDTARGEGGFGSTNE